LQSVSNHGLIILKKLSRKLFSNCVLNFVNSLYLICYACVQTFDMIGVKIYRLKLNKALDNEYG